jgi:sigma-B regulation protein RsbU (phosphoserine phosphatase)
MKLALTLFLASNPFLRRLDSLLRKSGLSSRPIKLRTLFEQIQDPSVSILLLDGHLLSELDAADQERLATICQRKKLPVLLTNSEFSTVQPSLLMAWTCGIIRNGSDEVEWAEKIDLYQHLCRLEKKVQSLQIQIETDRREDEEELRSAAQIQQSLLPQKLPSLSHFNVSCHFLPFEKIGGDLFTITQVDEETMMLFLLDVSGHGISSAMVSVSVHQSLSLHTGQIVKRVIDKPPYYRLLSPVEVMTELANEYPFERFEMFFTIVYMLINIHTGQTRYCSAGHPPPILQRVNGEVQRLKNGGGLIGLPATGPFEQGELTLKQGDRLFLFSDGLIDHTDASGECFGEKRLIQNLTRNSYTLQESCQAGIDAMHNFRENLPPQDDVSLLGVEFTKSKNQINP